MLRSALWRFFALHDIIPLMNRDSLLERQAAATERFNELQKQKTDIEQELFRLQGEHRIVAELLAELENVDSPIEGEVIDANTITVEEPEE